MEYGMVCCLSVCYWNRATENRASWIMSHEWVMTNDKWQLYLLSLCDSDWLICVDGSHFGPFSLVASKYLIHTTRVLIPVQYRRSEADPSSIKLSSTGAACCCCTLHCPMYRSVNLTNFTVLRSARKTKKAKAKPRQKTQSTPIFHSTNYYLRFYVLWLNYLKL